MLSATCKCRRDCKAFFGSLWDTSKLHVIEEKANVIKSNRQELAGVRRGSTYSRWSVRKIIIPLKAAYRRAMLPYLTQER